MFFILIISDVYGNTEIRCVTEEFPPFNYTNEKKLIGISVDISHELFKVVEFEYKIEMLPWARAYDIAPNEGYVMIFTIGRNANRENLFHWIGKVATVNSVLFSSAEKNIEIHSIEDLQQYTIAATTSDLRHSYLTKNLGLKSNVVSVNQYSQGLKMLISGRVDLWAMHEHVAQHIRKREGIQGSLIKPAFKLEKISNYQSYIALSRKFPKPIVKLFQSAYKKLESKGVIREISNKYLN